MSIPPHRRFSETIDWDFDCVLITPDFDGEELNEQPSTPEVSAAVAPVTRWQSSVSSLIDGRYVSVLGDPQVSIDADYVVHGQKSSFSLDEIVKNVVSAAARVKTSRQIPVLERALGVYLAGKVAVLYEQASNFCAQAPLWTQYRRKTVELSYLISGYPPALLEQASRDFRTCLVEEYGPSLNQEGGHASVCDSLCLGGKEHTVQTKYVLEPYLLEDLKDFLPPDFHID